MNIRSIVMVQLWVCSCGWTGWLLGIKELYCIISLMVRYNFFHTWKFLCMKSTVCHDSHFFWEIRTVLFELHKARSVSDYIFYQKVSIHKKYITRTTFGLKSGSKLSFFFYSYHFGAKRWEKYLKCMKKWFSKCKKIV